MKFLAIWHTVQPVFVFSKLIYSSEKEMPHKSAPVHKLHVEKECILLQAKRLGWVHIVQTLDYTQNTDSKFTSKLLDGCREDPGKIVYLFSMNRFFFTSV